LPRPPPSELIFPVTREFLRRLVVGLGALPIQATSWFRTPEENRNAEGDSESQHLFGLAVDIVGSDDALRRAIVAARGVGLIAVPEPSHLHVQAFPRGALARAGVRFPS